MIKVINQQENNIVIGGFKCGCINCYLCPSLEWSTDNMVIVGHHDPDDYAIVKPVWIGESMSKEKCICKCCNNIKSFGWLWGNDHASHGWCDY